MPKSIPSDVKTVMQAAANKPVHLLKIELDDTTLYFARSMTAVTFPTSGGQTYAAWAFLFSPIIATLTLETDRCKIEIDNTDLTFSTSYLADNEFQGRRITLSKVFQDKLASADNEIILFTGEMGAPKIIDKGKKGVVQIMALSDFNTLGATFPARAYAKPCTWVFDGTECLGGGATLADPKTDGAAESGSSTTQIIDTMHRGEADDYWITGKLTMTSGNNDGERRMIKGSTNSTGAIDIIVPLPNALGVGDTYNIERGCDKTGRTCKNTFDNWINYGGFIALPKRVK